MRIPAERLCPPVELSGRAMTLQLPCWATICCTSRAGAESGAMEESKGANDANDRGLHAHAASLRIGCMTGRCLRRQQCDAPAKRSPGRFATTPLAPSVACRVPPFPGQEAGLVSGGRPGVGRRRRVHGGCSRIESSTTVDRESTGYRAQPDPQAVAGDAGDRGRRGRRVAESDWIVELIEINTPPAGPRGYRRRDRWGADPQGVVSVRQ